MGNKGSTWGKGSFGGLKSDKISNWKAEDDNLMNRLNRTCSAEAWKAAFHSSLPKTMIVGLPDFATKD